MARTDSPKSIHEQLGRLAVPADQYQADFDLHGRSVEFSAELVRLALAGIGVVGFLVVQSPEELRNVVLGTFSAKVLLAGGVFGFAAAAACGLLHRFFAGGAMFHHLQVIKGLLLEAQGAESVAGFVRDNVTTRTVLLLRCHRFLALSALLLAAASGLVGAAFVTVLLLAGRAG